jgi:hypothetical protein
MVSNTVSDWFQVGFKDIFKLGFRFVSDWFSDRVSDWFHIGFRMVSDTVSDWFKTPCLKPV